MPVYPEIQPHSLSNVQIWGTQPPSAGRWNRGDICWNSAPTGGPLAWVCIAAGEPGTWVPLNVVPYADGVYPHGNNKMTFGTAPPTSGTWSRGDICWNTQPSAGDPPGWVCVSGGTPGTWKAMANLAA